MNVERPAVHLGFRRDVEAETLAGWVARQDAAAMLDALHAVPVAPGDSVLVPAGIPHAIGAGVFLVELQEPTDLSVLLEWDGFAVDGVSDGHLGLGFDVALACVDRRGWGAERLAGLIRNAGAIFLGAYTPEAIGDYVAGSNHVLPTARSARFSSGLGVLDFMKRTSILKCGPDQLAELGPAAIALGEAEGLDAHARSVAIRLNRR